MGRMPILASLLRLLKAICNNNKKKRERQFWAFMVQSTGKTQGFIMTTFISAVVSCRYAITARLASDQGPEADSGARL